MSDQNMSMNVDIKTTSDASAITKLEGQLSAFDKRIRRLGSSPANAFAQGFERSAAAARGLEDRISRIGRAAAQAAGDRTAAETKGASAVEAMLERIDRTRKAAWRDGMADLRTEWGFRERMQRQRLAGEREAAREAKAAAKDIAQAHREAGRIERASVAERERERAAATRRRATAWADVRDGGQGVVSRTRDVYTNARQSARGVMVGPGAAVAAGAKGIAGRMAADQAETLLKIFGDDEGGRKFNPASIAKMRRQWLDNAAFSTGNTAPDAIRAFTEISKSGIKNPKENTQLALKAGAGLELETKQVASLMGLVDRNLGAASTPKRMQSVLNSIAVAAKEDPTNAPEIVEGMKRGFGALSLGNMSPEDLAVLVSGGQSVGIQPGKAGTFVSTIMKDLTAGSFAHGQRGKDLNEAARMLGFGNAKGMARSASTDSTATIFRVLEKLEGMTDEQRGRVTHKLSQTQWSDEDLMMLQGLKGLKSTHAAVHDPKNANFLDEASNERMQAWDKQWARTKAIFSRFWESVGTGFEDIFNTVNAYFYNSANKFDWSTVSNHVKSFLGGFVNGLGFKDIGSLLESVFGQPGEQGGNYLESFKQFGKGLGEGLRSIGEAARSFLSAFTGGSSDPETIGRLTGKIVGLSAALVVLSPVIGVLGMLASGALALASAFKLISGAARLALAGTAAGAAAGGATAAAGAGAAAAGAAGAAAGKAGLLGKAAGALGVVGLAEAAQSYGALQVPDTSKPGGWGRSIVDFLDPGLGSRLYGDKAAVPPAGDQATGPGWVDPPTRETGKATAQAPGSAPAPGTAPTDKAAQPPGAARGQAVMRMHDDIAAHVQAALIVSLDTLRASIDKLAEIISKAGGEGGLGNGGKFDKTSGAVNDAESTNRLAAKLQLASRNTVRLVDDQVSRQANVIRASVGGADAIGRVTGAQGLAEIRERGGSTALYGALPGQRLPGTGQDFRSGMGADGEAIPPRGSAAEVFGSKAPGIMAKLQKDFGLTRAQAAGILGNLGHESAGFTAYNEGGGGPGVGWAQWTDPGRKARFLEHARRNGLDPKSDEASYGFLKWELENTHRKALANLRRESTVEGATRQFEADFEGARVKHMGRRIGYAQRAMDGGGGTAGSPYSPANGAAGKAVDNAVKLLGAGSGEAARALGSRMSPGQWCADFVNGALKSSGVEGVRSSVANSFLEWGRRATGKIQKGDVVVEHRGKGVGNPGGHVGLATGREQYDARTDETYVETISGNHGGRVGRSWVAKSQAAVRRAQEAMAGKPGSFTSGRDGADDGYASSGWKRADGSSAEDLAKLSPAEKLAKAAPPMPRGGGAGAGGGKSQVHAPITINNNGDAEHTANQVQRRIQDTSNYLTHDLQFENI